MGLVTKATGIVIILTLFLVGLSFMAQPEPEGNIEFKEMPRFESYAQLKAAFEEAGENQYSGRGILESFGGAVMSQTMDSAAAPNTAMKSDGTSYSTTNVQVQGVDEADIVKTDGKYIYNFSENKLVITDAYPIESASIISNTKLDGIYPTEMFISGDKLLVFGNKIEERTGNSEIADTSMVAEDFYYYGGGNVAVQLYDISNRNSPQLEKELEFEGSYLTSRLIGENAYFVVNSWPEYYGCEEEYCLIPLMVEDGAEKRVAEVTDIAYLPPMPAENFITIASLNMQSAEMQKETIVGNANTVYASQGNIYLAGIVWTFPEVPIFRNEIRAIAGDFETTTVNKFGLENGKIGFIGQGSVPGHVLNQFSLDEFEGNFRVATTIGWNGSSGVYVLDSEMNTIGALEDLAPGESIYSARFMGEKAYLVTFKKVDPLFVIDLSDPTNPRVLGKLKIPGYSDYLHPIDETHLIGVGKDSIASEYEDYAWYQGIKMAVFNVSDVANPKEMHKIIIGDRGTHSYALHDHRAFLYDKEKSLLVLPIMLAEIPEEQKKPLEDNMRSPTYGEYVFQGAFVYRLTLENGFEERGRITHVSAEDELKRGYYYDDSYSVKRALYIGNVLYTLSGDMLKANTLDSLAELKEFTFE